jgi:hypothetical protein
MKPVKYLLVLSILIMGIKVSAQYDYPGAEDTTKILKKSRHSDTKVFFGGVPGLMFGSTTYIELPPFVGYKFTPYLWAGIGPLYQYYKEKSLHYETSTYGGKVFAQVFVIRNLAEKIRINLGDIFLYGESSMLNFEPTLYDPYTFNYYKESRKWINVTLIGFGFRYPLGDRSGFSINILWDVTHNPEYSFPNPEIRVGFDI